MKVVRFGVAGLGGAWQGVARHGNARRGKGFKL